MTIASGRRGLWQPPTETLEALAAVLRRHWRAAAGSRSARLFWTPPTKWLAPPAEPGMPVDVSAQPVTAGQVTTSRPAAD